MPQLKIQNLSDFYVKSVQLESKYSPEHRKETMQKYNKVMLVNEDLKLAINKVKNQKNQPKNNKFDAYKENPQSNKTDRHPLSYSSMTLHRSSPIRQLQQRQASQRKPSKLSSNPPQINKKISVKLTMQSKDILYEIEHHRRQIEREKELKRKQELDERKFLQQCNTDRINMMRRQKSTASRKEQRLIRRNSMQTIEDIKFKQVLSEKKRREQIDAINVATAIRFSPRPIHCTSLTSKLMSRQQTVRGTHSPDLRSSLHIKSKSIMHK